MTHPIIRLQVAQFLNVEYDIPAEKAVPTAEKLIGRLKVYGLEIVREGWVPTYNPRERFDWNDIAEVAAELEADGRKPWDPPELH